MKAEVMTITPEEAQRLLTKNIGNRNPIPSNIRKMADDMSNGRWVLNGEPIIMNGDRLLDGQNRLMACISANVPFTTLVVSGVQSDAMKTINTGKPRNTASILKMEGHVNTNHLASAAHWHYAITRSAGKQTMATERRDAPLRSPAMVSEWISMNPSIVDSVSLCISAYAKNLALNVGILAAIHFEVSKRHPVLAMEFVEGLASGANMHQYDPRYMLRERLYVRLGNAKRETQEHLAGLYIKAWNAFATGKILGVLRFRENESVPALV